MTLQFRIDFHERNNDKTYEGTYNTLFEISQALTSIALTVKGEGYLKTELSIISDTEELELRLDITKKGSGTNLLKSLLHRRKYWGSEDAMIRYNNYKKYGSPNPKVMLEKTNRFIDLLLNA